MIVRYFVSYTFSNDNLGYCFGNIEITHNREIKDMGDISIIGDKIAKSVSINRESLVILHYIKFD